MLFLSPCRHLILVAKLGPIAVCAEKLEAIGEVVFDQPRIKLRTHFFSMLASIPMNVIYSKHGTIIFATAGADAPIVIDDALSQAFFTPLGVGAALFLKA